MTFPNPQHPTIRKYWLLAFPTNSFSYRLNLSCIHSLFTSKEQIAALQHFGFRPSDTCELVPVNCTYQSFTVTFNLSPWSLTSRSVLCHPIDLKREFYRHCFRWYVSKWQVVQLSSPANLTPFLWTCSVAEHYAVFNYLCEDHLHNRWAHVGDRETQVASPRNYSAPITFLYYSLRWTVYWLWCHTKRNYDSSHRGNRNFCSLWNCFFLLLIKGGLPAVSDKKCLPWCPCKDLRHRLFSSPVVRAVGKLQTPLVDPLVHPTNPQLLLLDFCIQALNFEIACASLFNYSCYLILNVGLIHSSSPRQVSI